MSTARASYQAAVDAYVAAGGDASVQRVITAIAQVSKKLDQWYDRQLADLGISHGDWSVLSQLATADGGPLTPSRLADAAGLAASSMTSRLDRMCRRGLVERTPDPSNRTRVLVTLTDPGWQLFAEAVRARRRSSRPSSSSAVSWPTCWRSCSSDWITPAEVRHARGTIPLAAGWLTG